MAFTVMSSLMRQALAWHLPAEGMVGRGRSAICFSVRFGDLLSILAFLTAVGAPRAPPSHSHESSITAFLLTALVRAACLSPSHARALSLLPSAAPTAAAAAAAAAAARCGGTDRWRSCAATRSCLSSEAPWLYSAGSACAIAATLSSSLPPPSRSNAAETAKITNPACINNNSSSHHRCRRRRFRGVRRTCTSRRRRCSVSWRTQPPLGS